MSLMHTRWQLPNRYLHSALPGELTRWLLDPDSLTRRLQQLCPGRFEVRVLSQCRARPARDEARVLGMRRQSNALIRQVQLLCDGRPLVYARTVIPVRSLRGRLQRLARLGNRPLGGVLFADPGMQRDMPQLACIRPGEALYHAAAGVPGRRASPIWGRRSVFRLSGHPLLVSEIFLPAFPAAAGTQPRWTCG